MIVSHLMLMLGTELRSSVATAPPLTWQSIPQTLLSHILILPSKLYHTDFREGNEVNSKDKRVLSSR